MIQVGDKFGRLTVKAFAGIDAHHHRTWRCECSCGITRAYSTSHLHKGTRSCGCFRREVMKLLRTKHDMYGTPEYNVWRTMHQRCENPNSNEWPYYGGRGIKVCERWRKFELFIADMGARPGGKREMWIERVDNDGNYESSNCVWATPAEQALNKRPRGAA